MSKHLIRVNGVEQLWDRRAAALATRKGFGYRLLLDGIEPEDGQGIKSLDSVFLWSGTSVTSGIVGVGDLAGYSDPKERGGDFQVLYLHKVLLPSEEPMPWPAPPGVANCGVGICTVCIDREKTWWTEWPEWCLLKIPHVLEGGVVLRFPGRASIPQVRARCFVTFRQGLELKIWKETGWRVGNCGQPTHKISLLLDSPLLQPDHLLAVDASTIGGERRYVLNTSGSAERWLLTEAHTFFAMDRRSFGQVLALAGMDEPSLAGINYSRLVGASDNQVDISDRLSQIRRCAAGTILVSLCFAQGGPLSLPRRVSLDTSDFDHLDHLEQAYVYYGN